MLEILRVFAYIYLIERRVDLIEDTERRRTQLQYRKINTNRNKRLLTARERDQILDNLARRRDLDLNTGFENMLGIGQLERRRTAAEQLDEYLLEV